MAQKSGFFNSINKDRLYDASDIANFLSKFFTNGIFNNSLLVSANDNMTVSVSTGNANINGYGYENTEELILDINEADSELGRIDSVILRLDLSNRQITAEVLQGQYATTPSQPNITRSGNIYDLRLANILISAGATRITTDLITDTRFSSDCGNVVQAVQHINTNDIFLQYQTYFDNWFANLQEQLDDNQIGHLQNEIDDIRAKVKLDYIYPIGSIIYNKNDAFNPNEFYGGTWLKIEDVFLLASSSTYALGSTGGEKEHTLTISEMPAHKHGITINRGSGNQTWGGLTGVQKVDGVTYGTAGTSEVGEGQPHNNMPPYLAVNVWERVA